MFFLTVNSYAQKDTINQNASFHFKKNGISIGFLMNPFNKTLDKNYPYNQMLNSGVDPLTNYKEKIYLNSFHDVIISPIIAFNYFGHKRFAHSLGMGLSKNKINTSISGIYDTERHFQSVFINYQVNYLLFKEDRIKIQPYVGLGLNWGNKKLSDHRLYVYNSSVSYTINDHSNLFLVQLPIGMFYTINQHLFLKIGTVLNFIAFSNGKHEFLSSSENNAFKNEVVDYKKMLFINTIISENVLFHNYLQFQFGFKF